MGFKSRFVFFSSSCHVLLNNKNFFKTVIWVMGILGKKKYYILNNINIKSCGGVLLLKSYNYLYFKYCVLYSILIKNTIYGLMRPFKSYVLIKGLGFKLSYLGGGNIINFKLGYSHNIKYYVSNFLKIDILPKKAKAFCVIGVDYQKVKESVARIKAFKKNNSYKYRGIYDFGRSYFFKNNKRKTS